MADKPWKEFSSPDEFKQFLKGLNIRELMNLVRDLDQHPEDVNYLRAVQAELKDQATKKIMEM